VVAKVLVVLVYLVVAAVFVYGVADEDWAIPDALVLIGLISINVLAGAVLRWWALFLPAAAVLLAIPAGVSDAFPSAEIPIWVGVMFGGLFAIPLILAGVLANSYVRRLRAAGVQSPT